MHHRLGAVRYICWLVSIVVVSLLFIVVAAMPIQASAPGGTVNISGRKWFDTCGAPNSGDMQTWWYNSPYWNVGVYVGGINVGQCNANLSSWWVSTVGSQGWRFIPIYVGRQAPCTTRNYYKISTDTNTAVTQANNAAKDAESTANAVGFTQGTIIYLDMEAFSIDDASCRSIVKIYVNEWVRQLRVDGYKTGVYGSSCGSAASDWTTLANIPDDVMLGDWNGNAGVYGVSCVSDGYWIYHQRHHQYAGNVRETYDGGKTYYTIDRDCAEGLVAGAANDDGSPNTCP